MSVVSVESVQIASTGMEDPTFDSSNSVRVVSVFEQAKASRVSAEFLFSDWEIPVTTEFSELTFVSPCSSIFAIDFTL